jgi:trimeric autotransporter adhesin
MLLSGRPFFIHRATTHKKPANMKIIFFILLITVSCKKNNSSNTSITYTIGQSFGGGKIFYIDGTGKHGLIVAINDQSISAEFWDNGSHVQTNATNTTDGLSNTTQIINVIGNTGSYAAKLCRDNQGGGFTDWFLPSIDQLSYLYSQRTVLGGGFSNNYWSSTESAPDYSYVQIFNFLTGAKATQSRVAKSWVRAVRAF